MGADVNCNIGITSKRFCHTLGPHGINNRNVKGRELSYLYKTNNLKNLLSCFRHNNYVTYRSFNDKIQHKCWKILFAAINFQNKLVTAK